MHSSDEDWSRSSSRTAGFGEGRQPRRLVQSSVGPSPLGHEAYKVGLLVEEKRTWRSQSQRQPQSGSRKVKSTGRRAKRRVRERRKRGRDPRHSGDDAVQSKQVLPASEGPEPGHRVDWQRFNGSGLVKAMNDG